MSSKIKSNDYDIRTKLSLHGASSSSSSHAITTLSISLATEENDSDESTINYLVFSSHGIINLATTSEVDTKNVPSTFQNNPLITTIHKTLRSNRIHKDTIITALNRVDCISSSSSTTTTTTTCNDEHWNMLSILATGYSNGGISIWYCNTSQKKREQVIDNTNKSQTHDENYHPEWNEIILLEEGNNYTLEKSKEGFTSATTNSITDISGIYHIQNDLFILSVATAQGLQIYQTSLLHVIHQQQQLMEKDECTISAVAPELYNVQRISKCGALACVYVGTRVCPYNFEIDGTISPNASSTVETMIFCGTALPRHNKIWIYTSSSSSKLSSSSNNAMYNPFISQGYLIGHEDWITCLAWKPIYSTTSQNEPDYFLASGSHDAKIRLWKFHPSYSSPNAITIGTDENDNDNLIDDDDDDDKNEELLDTLLEEEGEARLVLKNLVNESSIAITLEALLIGHEEGVTSISWKPTNTKNSNNTNLCLVSSSMDKSILLWSPAEEEEGIWIPTTRVGSAGGILGGSIGSSLLGFLHVTFWKTPTNDFMLVGVGYGGSIHLWKELCHSIDENNKKEHENSDKSAIEKATNFEIDKEDVSWQALPCLTGHFKGVSDLDWESVSGEYLLTVSYDQTCRLWAEVNVLSKSASYEIDKRWMEVGRPQVHGYDLNAITCVGGIDGGKEPRYRFVSGADEKQLRAFDAPVATLRLVSNLSNHSSILEETEKKGDKRVERAYIPALGLSNKGMVCSGTVGKEDDGKLDSDDLPSSASTSTNVMIELPLERDLAVTTLWPEVRKLYGHGSELVCLASTCSKTNEVLVASACKARDVEHASIRLWDVDTGICAGVLKGGHRSSVATLSFDLDGSTLASSGKDRRLCIWKKKKEGEDKGAFFLAAAVDSAHKRIVWSVHFCPHDPTLLASGGRDGVVKIWKILENDENNVTEINELHRFEIHLKEGQKKTESVTSVSFTPVPIKDSGGNETAVLAVGLENGLIELWAIPLNSSNVAQRLQRFSPSLCHIAAVKKLSWRPYRGIVDAAKMTGISNISTLTLASCGLDHGVRIFEVSIEQT